MFFPSPFLKTLPIDCRLRTLDLEGDEFLAYVRDSEIISPLVAMALSNYQKIRVDPYGPFQTCLIAAQGLKISKTYNNKFGVFYFKKS